MSVHMSVFSILSIYLIFLSVYSVLLYFLSMFVVSVCLSFCLYLFCLSVMSACLSCLPVRLFCWSVFSVGLYFLSFLLACIFCLFWWPVFSVSLSVNISKMKKNFLLLLWIELDLEECPILFYNMNESLMRNVSVKFKIRFMLNVNENWF